MNLFTLGHDYLFILILGMARILPIALFLPWFNTQVLGGMIVKNVVVFFIITGFFPFLSVQYSAVSNDMIVAALVQEVVIGLICGLCLSLPFWIAMAIGEIIDNQRGATISSTMNPGVGVETSIYASFMNYFYGATFLLSGGMVTVCRAIAKSYQIFPIAQPFNFNKELALHCAHLLNELMTRAVILIGPVLIGLFITECALGLLSRFASQLNAFSVSLSLKSAVAIFILLFYLTPLLMPQIININIIELLPGRP